MDVITTNVPTQDNSRKTQCARILRLLIEARGSWVPSPEIADCALQYNARLFELRRLGFVIENKTETDEAGVRRSWFRLVSSPLSDTKRPRHPWKNAFSQRRMRNETLPLFAGVRS